MKKVILIMALLLIASSAYGFNGERKGFVLGGGLGFSPFSKWSASGERIDMFGDLHLFKSDESGAGVALHFLIGYAWDEKNMIVYESNATAYNSGFFNETLVQGFDGPVWYHYFGLVGKSAFTSVGLGMYSLTIRDVENIDPGFGILLGGGYEFARHWQVGGYLGFGSTSQLSIIDYKHSSFSVVVSTVAF